MAVTADFEAYLADDWYGHPMTVAALLECEAEGGFDMAVVMPQAKVDADFHWYLASPHRPNRAESPAHNLPPTQYYHENKPSKLRTNLPENHYTIIHRKKKADFDHFEMKIYGSYFWQ